MEMNKLWRRITNLGLLALLVYAPWHDDFFLAGRRYVGFEPFGLKLITYSGLTNFLLISWTVALLALLLIRSYRARKPELLEGLLMCFPVFLAANTRVFDSRSVIVLENGILITALALALIRSGDLRSELGFFKRWALPVLLVSYVTALLLPLLLPIPGKEISKVFSPVIRYIGWKGEGGPYGICGMNLAALGAVEILRTREPSAIRRRFALLAIAFGLLGIYLNVLRIALVAAGFCFGASYVLARQRLDRSKQMFFAAMVAVCLVIFFTGKFKKKSVYMGSFGDTVTQVSQKKVGFGNIDNVFMVNGRNHLFNVLTSQPDHNILVGAGTGAAARRLKELKFPIPEPQNEYLRIFFEQGLLGLMGFLMLGAAIFRRYARTPVSVLLVALGTCMLTENILVYPTFGYGPLLLFSLVVQPVCLASRASHFSQWFARVKLGARVEQAI